MSNGLIKHDLVNSHHVKRYIMVGCFILGSGIVFNFEIGQYRDFTQLKKAIWEEDKEYFESAGIKNEKRFKLWKVQISTKNNNKYNKLLENHHEDLDVKEDFGGERLDETWLIDSIFKCLPPEEHIHIMVQPPPPATTGKRPLGDSDEGQNSKRAKLADPNIISTARKIMENIMKLDKDESSYSNPENFLSLPYPYSGEKLPIDRFDIHDGFFTFMGRKKFEQVLGDINKLRPRFYMKLFVYGTVGYGKSHILSAITCFLFRTGRRVVFLPDCRQLSFDPVNYVKLALFLTYHDDDTKISKINACEDFCQIINFCESLDEKLYFIVDQMNALDELDNTGVSLEKKQQTRENLDKMTNRHYYIMSSSANNKTMLHLMAKQTGELKIRLFGGFDEEEMKGWWNEHIPDLPKIDNQQKEQIEDITGKVPLFLKFLLELDHKDFKDAFGYLNEKLISMIQKPMTLYSENLLSKNNQHIWDRHVGLMSSFITNSRPMMGYGDDDYDHRYFYIGDNNICYYVCGLVRDSMADYLFQKGKTEIFTSMKWINCIENFRNNPSVIGFFAEKACLASIFRNGLMADSVNLKPGKMEFFYEEKEITFFSNEEKCIFYIPSRWNQKAIDGLIISQTKDILYVAPIQVTLNKDSHSDSEGEFFSSIWPKLKPNLSRYEDKLKIIFIWITHRGDTNILVDHLTKETRNENYTRVITGFVNIDIDIDRCLRTVITNNGHTQSQVIKIEETNHESNEDIEQKSAQRGRSGRGRRGRGRPKKNK